MTTEIDSRTRQVRTRINCEYIRRATTGYLDKVHASACALERLGHGAVTDEIDRLVDAVLKLTDRLENGETAAEIAKKIEENRNAPF